MKRRRSGQVRKHTLQIPKSLLLGFDKDIEKLKKFGEKYTQFHWHYYFCLALQRGKILPEIKQSLLSAAIRDFKFSKWQRVVAWKYSNIPFSVAGSIKDIGGRFNIGNIEESFAPFPALYLAEHKDTALQEYLCQKIDSKNEEQVLASALANPKSLTNVSLSGRLSSVIDLRGPQKLQPFIDLIENFTVPDFLIESAKEINEPIIIIRDIKTLLHALNFPNWRLWPMQFDVPATGQIFGQLVAGAGIEGIVYLSKFTGKECVVIFPQNFEDGTDSFLALDDEPPTQTQVRHLDGKIWKLHHKELMGL